MSLVETILVILMSIPWLWVISITSVLLLLLLVVFGKELTTITWAKLMGRPLAIIQRQSGKIKITTCKYNDDTNPPSIEFNGDKHAVSPDAVKSLSGCRAFYIYPEVAATINPEAAKASEIANKIGVDLEDLKEVVSFDLSYILTLAPYNITPSYVSSVELSAKNKNMFGKRDIGQIAIVAITIMMGAAVALFVISTALSGGGGMSIGI